MKRRIIGLLTASIVMATSVIPVSAAPKAADFSKAIDSLTEDARFEDGLYNRFAFGNDFDLSRHTYAADGDEEREQYALINYLGVPKIGEPINPDDILITVYSEEYDEQTNTVTTVVDGCDNYFLYGVSVNGVQTPDNSFGVGKNMIMVAYYHEEYGENIPFSVEFELDAQGNVVDDVYCFYDQSFREGIVHACEEGTIVYTGGPIPDGQYPNMNDFMVIYNDGTVAPFINDMQIGDSTYHLETTIPAAANNTGYFVYTGYWGSSLVSGCNVYSEGGPFHYVLPVEKITE